MILFDKYRKRKSLGFYAILIFSLCAFQAIVLNPLYLWISSDTLLANEIVLLGFDILFSLLNLSFYWIALAFLLFFSVRFSSKAVLSSFGIYIAAVVFRYAAELLSGYMILGFPLLSDFLTDAVYLGIDVLLDLVIWAVAFGLSVLLLRTCIKREKGAGYSLLTKHVPFEKLVDFKNPISRAMAVLALVPSSVQILYRIRYDIYLGAPADVIDLLWMILYYVSDLLTVLIGYLLIRVLIDHLSLKEIKSKILYDENQSEQS